MPNRCALIVIALCFSQVTPVYTQKDTFSFSRLAKQVLADPTTYISAGVYLETTEGDWASSQIWFQHGFKEENPLYTVGGQSPGIPISFADGNRQIVLFSAEVLGYSLVANISSRTIEHLLTKRFPDHKRLIASVGWATRIGVSIFQIRYFAGPHIGQWEKNNQIPVHWPN